MTSRRTLAFGAALLALAMAAWAADHSLEKADSDARREARSAKESVSRSADQERARRALLGAADELGRGLGEEGGDPERVADAMRRRLADIRKGVGPDARLDPLWDSLDRLYASLPARPLASYYARGLCRAAAEELRDLAERPVPDFSALAQGGKRFHVPIAPDDFAPVDVPLEQFKRLGPIRIFVVKHRVRRPRGYAVTTSTDIVAGKHLVQTGVEIVGRARRVRHEIFDGDLTFNIGELHLEVTPEWRGVLHRGMPRLHDGDLVRVRGWTYYDIFHKAEPEYDPSDPELGITRRTLWEIHPVQEIEVLPAP